MKTAKLILSALALLMLTNLTAQQAKISNFRPYGQEGINVFEAPKETDDSFDGLKVRVDGNFAQKYKALDHSNKATPNIYTDSKGTEYDLNKLYPLSSGFNLATANLNLDVQLDDGIRLALENYMSSRHHQEFWVKGGYIQVDKLPMFNNPEWYSKYVRVKIGHFQINYGDQQFRRTDNGNAMYNPFVGNYIMDAFATEIGGEVYLFPTSNVMAMVGMTNGLIKGDVLDYGANQKKSPSIYAKLAYDKQVTEDFRFRLSGSVYTNQETPRNTLYGGDRTGSRFYFAMVPEYYLNRGVLTASTTDNQAFSGRVNPGFNNEITAFQINPFLKYKGLELFGVYEMASGKANSEADKRDFTQIGAELTYRFLPREQLYIAGRYNQASGQLAGIPNDVSIDRIEIAAGWFPTKNLLLKGAYVKQNYNDFPTDNLYSEGEFNGFMIEAVVGF